MNNLVTISNAKDNTLEFDVDVQGIETDDMSVRFVIVTEGMKLGFDSIRGVNKKWSVKIPALPILDITSYPFYIDVTVDGYHFEPLQGSVNVVGTHEIYASKPENVTLTPGKPKPKKVEDIIKDAKTPEHPPKEKKVKTPEAPIIKPDRKFTMQPLKVKDSKKLFKTLMDNPKPKRKTDDKLDDEILDIFKKAKEAKKLKPAEPKKETKPVAEKDTAEKTTEPKNTEKEIKAKETKKTEEKPKKKITAKKSVEESSGHTDARSIAEDILHSVTGLGSKKDEEIVTENPNDDKIKQIIKEEVTTPPKPERKKPEIKEVGGIKKITKDKKVIEVDGSKEQQIKDVLKKSDDMTEKSNEGKRTVVTKPFKKKDVTIH